MKQLDDFESNRVWTAGNRIYLDGKEMRGTIDAVYDFAKKSSKYRHCASGVHWKPQHGAFKTKYNTDLKFNMPTAKNTTKETLEKVKNEQLKTDYSSIRFIF